MRDIIMNKNKLINGNFVISELEEMKKDVYTIMSSLYEGDKSAVIEYMRGMYEKCEMLVSLIRDEKKEGEE